LVFKIDTEKFEILAAILKSKMAAESTRCTRKSHINYFLVHNPTDNMLMFATLD
jgi:hypothetical protein